MSSEANRNGLSRYIPNEIKRRIRRRDGFGCVVCGLAIYDYEHFSPPFSEAFTHDEAGIILLCDTCHRKKGRFLSIDTIKKHAETPKAKEEGFSFGAFDIGFQSPEIIIGPISARNVHTLVEIDGVSMFSVSAPEVEGGPFRIDARLYDESGKVILDIVQNEWQTPSDNWDVEIVGAVITIRSKLGQIPLQLRSDPPHRIVVERLNFYYNGTTLNFMPGSPINISSANGNHIVADSLSFDGCQKAIEINAAGFRLGIGGGRTSIHMRVNANQHMAKPSSKPIPQTQYNAQHFALTGASSATPLI